MKIFMLFIIFFFLTSPSQGLVNMRNGSYNENWIDIIHPSKGGYDMKISRTYSSRSLFIGIFGFGWCSFIETELKISSAGDLIFRECGGGPETVFYPTNFDAVSPSTTAQLILDAERKESRSISSGNRSVSKKELINNSIQRFKLAKKFHLLDGKSVRGRKNKFFSSASKLSFISFNGRTYQYQTASGEKFTFNTDGYFIKHQDRAGNTVDLRYKNKRLFSITDNVGRQFQFTYDASTRLKTIHNGSGLKASYEFSGEDLSEVTNSWKNTYFFNYDNRHNLTKVVFPGNTEINIKYNGEKDWITEYNNRVQCTETFDYNLSSKNPKDHYWSIVNQKCPGSKTSGKFEYLYKPGNPISGKYLSQLNSKVSDKIKNATLHPTLGEIVVLKKNRSTEKYSFDELGAKKELETKIVDGNNRLFQVRKEKYTYAPNHSDIIRAIREESPAQGQRQARSAASVDYVYNAKGLLQRAKTSDGMNINVGWNKKGFLDSLKDQKLGTLKMAYGDSGSKPEKISHNQYGAINIEYTPSGEILSVKGTGQKSQPKKLINVLIQFVKPIGPVVDGLSF